MTSQSDSRAGLLAHVLPVAANLFDNSGSAIFLFDDQERLLYANDQYYKLVCHTLGTHPTWPGIIRDNFNKRHGLIIETNDIELWIQTASAKRRKQTYRQFEIDAWDGRWFLMTETLVPEVGLLGIGVDITKAKNTTTVLKQEYQHALINSETDSLTGMGNRRALDRLRKILVSNDRHLQVTALMIDIDQFKPYNDTLGHLQGDICLQQVAQAIQNPLKANETYPIRLGGDEFLVLLLDVTMSKAQQVAQRIRNSVCESAIPHPATVSGQVTLSIGLASQKITNPKSFLSLLKNADEALYQAKRSGRDRIKLV